MSTIRSSIMACLSVLAACRCGAGEVTVYELQAGSWLRDECEFCDRIPIERPLSGTFTVQVLPSGIGTISWSIDALDLRSPGDDYVVKGAGSYGASGGKSQEMILGTSVNGIDGVLLGTAGAPVTAPEPFVDIVVSEAKPYRDPDHIFTLRIRAAPQVALETYELETKGVDGSIFIDECLPCGRPTVPVPIAGTFLLGKVHEDPLYALYRVDAIDLVDAAGTEGLKIAGSGWYRQGGEVALTQDMELLLDVTERDVVTRGAILGNDDPRVTGTFPDLAIELLHRNPASDFSVFSLRIVAVPAAASAGFRRGDSNGDGTVDISDPVAILVWLFAGGRAPDCLDAADADHSGSHDLTDAVFTLGYLFLGGKPPPAPGPATCGTGGPPSLGCSSSSGCP